MHSLILLGGAALMGPDGAVVGRAVQKRRLALLARLALAPARTLSRDKLIAVLWPDASTEQARHLLSVSLHELRRSLGEDVLQARGDDLTLNPQAITTDVEAFQCALRDHQPEQAVALYAGPFMDGFFSNDAPELEQWIEGERTRLAHDFASALEQSATSASKRGDVAGAAKIWRRLAAQDPYNGRVARELMLALEAAGDRAAALQHARVHATLLEQEFGTQPDAELLRLADRLRTAPTTTPVSVAPVAKPAAVTTVAVDDSNKPVPVSTVRPVSNSLPKWIGLGVALLVVAVVWWFIAGPPPAAASIAVLRFRNHGPVDSMRYFGDGLSEEIINSLGQLPELRVASATSTFGLPATVTVQRVRELLGVSTVLEGTVRTGGGRLKVTARLIDARSDSTIWRQEFEYEGDLSMSRFLQLQEEIARGVVNELAVKLNRAASQGRLAKPTTRNLRALAYYYNGRPYFHMRTPSTVQTALQYFQRAVAEDSTYARAWAAIADAYVILGAYDYGVMAPQQAFSRAKQAAQKALRLDPELSEAHAALATVLFNYDYDWGRAETEFKRAIDLSPSNSHALHWYSLLLATQNRMGEARDAIERAREFDQVLAVLATSQARHFYFARDNKRAIDGFREVLQSYPQFATAQAGLGMAFVAEQQYDSAIAHYQAGATTLGRSAPVFIALTAHAQGLAGRPAQARAGLVELQRLAQRQYVPHEYFTLAYLGLGDLERAIDSLNSVYDARSGGIAYLRIEPVLEPLRNHPRFKALVRKAHLK